MPGLTVSTSPTSSAPTQPPVSSHSPSSRSVSPERPPYSPITPVLAAARIAPAQNGDSAPPTSSQSRSQPGQQYAVMNNLNLEQNAQSAHQPPYTHTQEAQISIPQPKPEQINFDDNPDVLAMRSTISILQLQARNAEQDMRALQRTKERAMGDPEGFVRSLGVGDVRSEGDGVGMMDEEDSSSEDEDEEEEAQRDGMDDVKMESEQSEVRMSGKTTSDVRGNEKWEKLPTPQNIVRCPPINWAKYGVVGEGLNKLHDDQVRRPSEGFPAKINPDGTYTQVYGDGSKREYTLAKPLGLNEVVPKPKKKK